MLRFSRLPEQASIDDINPKYFKYFFPYFWTNISISVEPVDAQRRLDLLCNHSVLDSMYQWQQWDSAWLQGGRGKYYTYKEENDFIIDGPQSAVGVSFRTKVQIKDQIDGKVVLATSSILSPGYLIIYALACIVIFLFAWFGGWISYAAGLLHGWLVVMSMVIGMYLFQMIQMRAKVEEVYRFIARSVLVDREPQRDNAN